MEASTETPAAPDKFVELRKKYPNAKPKAKVGRPLSPKNRLVFIEDLIANGFGSRRSIWRKVKDRELPKPFKWGNKAAWREASLGKRLDKKQVIAE